MKKAIQLSLPLMLILSAATGCAPVEPKESKTVDPIMLKITHQLRLHPTQALLDIAKEEKAKEEAQRKKEELARKARLAMEAKKKAAAIAVEKERKAKIAAEKERKERILAAKKEEERKAAEVAAAAKRKEEEEKAAKKTEAVAYRVQDGVAGKLNKHLGGKLAGKGESFVRSAGRNNVDVYLITAIAIHETGNGTSPAIRNKNNVGGLMGKNGLRVYESVDSSIEYLSNLIETSYYANGRNTIQEISSMYAPIGAGNDPNGLNRHWVGNVSDIYYKLKGNNS